MNLKRELVIHLHKKIMFGNCFLLAIYQMLSFQIVCKLLTDHSVERLSSAKDPTCE